ncbi:RNA-binding protein [Luteolibacter yonseiensis]|uniref:RNA-binding protein n=1 Tax=Luteolibacter yonseiensis TaxID=1144680 RepID=A0A934QZE5_9BACT|nr:RNA-binding protein [Luteolibacter yonseiensis]MBK1815538.1 RNA-binding protein [Luteolibacter yonseiensis]
MSNATQDSRNSGESRRRRSRGGSNRNRNNQNSNDRRSGGEREPRENRSGDNRGQSQHRRQESPRSEEFRPQAPRKYAPAKLTLWQKILKAVGLYKEPAPPSRLDRSDRAERPERSERPERKVESTPFPKSGSPKSNTRNARTGDGEARPPREPREARPPREPRKEGEPRQPKERTPRGDRPRGGDPRSVESTRVYVGNLSYDVTEQDLQELFKGVGAVRNVEIVYNRSTHRSKGYGFVEMLRMDEAIRSVEVLHDQHFMGRKMTVSGAKSKGQDEREDQEPQNEPTRVVLASTKPAVAPVEAAAVEAAPASEAPAAEPVIETIVEQVAPAAVEASPVAEVAPAAEAAPAVESATVTEVSATDLEAKYGFDKSKEEKTGDA